MDYEWDETKRKANLAKHQVDFAVAEDFEWETALETIDDRYPYHEERWITLGMIKHRLYVMVYVYRFEKIRIISLRKANKRERHYYETQT